MYCRLKGMSSYVRACPLIIHVTKKINEVIQAGKAGRKSKYDRQVPRMHFACYNAEKYIVNKLCISKSRVFITLFISRNMLASNYFTV